MTCKYLLACQAARRDSADQSVRSFVNALKTIGTAPRGAHYWS